MLRQYPKSLSTPTYRKLLYPLHRIRLPYRPQTPLCEYSSSVESLPRVAQPALWHAIVPKFMRKSDEPKSNARIKPKKEWNPATFYIVIFLLIGSNAIQMIALRNDFLNFSRKAEAKISLLKDVLGRVQKGENIDVEGLLGTGNEEQEKEWEEVLREIEEEERLWKSKEKTTRKRKTTISDDNDLPASEGASRKDSTLRRTSNKPPIRLVTTSDEASHADRGLAPVSAASKDDSTPEGTEKKPPRFF